MLDDYCCLEFVIFGVLVPFLAGIVRYDSKDGWPLPRQTETPSPSQSGGHHTLVSEVIWSPVLVVLADLELDM